MAKQLPLASGVEPGTNIFNYFSMKRPIMEAACYQDSLSHQQQLSAKSVENIIKTENNHCSSNVDPSTAENIEAAANVASMAASCMFNRLQDTSNYTTQR
jgi:hypothetical protein